jgi:hypothetical protein
MKKLHRFLQHSKIFLPLDVPQLHIFCAMIKYIWEANQTSQTDYILVVLTLIVK